MDEIPVWMFIGLIAGISTMLFGGAKRGKKSKKTTTVVVFCPYCGSDVGLEKIRNYICPHCNNGVAFYETYENITPRLDLANYNCVSCGTLNFENVKYCLNCGQEHGPTKRY